MRDGSGKMHLWVVLRMVRSGKETTCVIVNLSSRKCPSRQCQGTLTSRDHSFLSAPSHIRCDHSKAIPLKKMESLVKSGKIRPKGEDLSQNILERMRQVVLACRTTPGEVKGLLLEKTIGKCRPGGGIRRGMSGSGRIVMCPPLLGSIFSPYFSF